MAENPPYNGMLYMWMWHCILSLEYEMTVLVRTVLLPLIQNFLLVFDNFMTTFTYLLDVPIKMKEQWVVEFPFHFLFLIREET